MTGAGSIDAFAVRGDRVPRSAGATRRRGDSRSTDWAETVHEWRRTHSLGIAQAAARAGVGYSTWRAWEAGSMPRTGRLRDICQRLGLRPVASIEALTHSRNALTHYRMRAGLSGAELARRLMVSRGLVSSWERGLRSPHPTYYPAIAAALAVDGNAVAAIFDGGPPAKGDAVFTPGLGRERRAAGLTAVGLACAAQVHVSTLAAWESCRKPVPRRRIGRLAELLDTSPTRLVTGPSRQPTHVPPLAQLRKEHGLSRREVAARLGIGVKKLTSMETRGALPDVVAGRLAEMYGTSRTELARFAADDRSAYGRGHLDVGVDYLPYTAKYSSTLWTCLFDSLSAADRRWVLETLRRYVPQLEPRRVPRPHRLADLHSQRSSPPPLPTSRTA